MVKRQKLKVGDVFVIPTHDGRLGVGQAVGLREQPQLYYFAVLDEVLPEGSSSEQVISATRLPVLSLGPSMPAKFTAGHWSASGPRRFRTT